MKLDPLYHCNQCKLIVENLESLYFVEEESSRGFCCEKCIEDYFTPMINYFEQQEKELRDTCKLKEEPCLKYIGVEKYMEAVIGRPKEIWVRENSLNETNYTYISEFIDDDSQSFNMIVICTVYNYRPSFIFLATTTMDKNYLNHFRKGEKVEDVKLFLENAEEESHALEYDAELITELEQLKSSILAELMEIRSDSDIYLENYPLYDEFLAGTLESPDEIYVNNEYDEEVHIYIKACDKDGVSFFYIAICKMLEDENNEEVLIPILTFPSIDGEVSKQYKKGKIISGTLLN